MSSALPDFSGRVAIVTGAGSGIGRATARAFARAGGQVLAVGRREQALADTADGCAAIESFAADLRTPGVAERVAAAASDRFGRIDILINNAGATRMMPITEVTHEAVTDLMALNVLAPSLLARATFPALRATGGSIINVSSTYGHRPLPGAAHYAASKAALEQLTRSWAVELAADGVRVNAVAPGPTESEALSAAGLTPEMVEQIKRQEAARIPIGRRGNPEEVATWILRLADPDSTWLTGQVLSVDGGLELVQ